MTVSLVESAKQYIDLNFALSFSDEKEIDDILKEAGVRTVSV